VGVASSSFWTQDRGNGLFPLFYNSITVSRYPLTSTLAIEERQAA